MGLRTKNFKTFGVHPKIRFSWGKSSQETNVKWGWGCLKSGFTQLADLTGEGSVFEGVLIPQWTLSAFKQCQSNDKLL